MITETCAHIDWKVATTESRQIRVWKIINIPRMIPYYLEFVRISGPPTDPKFQANYRRARLPLVDSDATGVP